MRKKIAGLVVLAIGATSGGVARGAVLPYTQAVEATPGLLAYYQASGNANSSVNGYTGTLTPGATIDAAGSGPPIADDPTNRALKFDGTSQNGLVSSLSSGVSSAGSIVGFIKLGQLPSVAGRTFYVAGESSVGDDFDLQVQTDDKLYFYTTNTGAVASPAALGANAWTFVAATFTANGNRSLYVDGSLVASDTTSSHTDSGNPFTIGESTIFPGRSFLGGIDEVAFYNTQLTASQVQAIYNARTVPAPEPASAATVAVGLLMLAARRRRSK